MIILETVNLILRVPELTDAKMLFELVNQQDFKHFIGDKKVATLDDAEKLIADSFIKHYDKNGFCLFVIELKNELKNDLEKAGLCGLVNRPELDDIDIGYAMLSRYQGRGIISEAALAVRDYAKNELKLSQLLGITSLDNHASIHLLEKIGLTFKEEIYLGKETSKIKLFSMKL